MNKQKLKWIVPGVVVGLGVLWWGASWYASSKAEDRLRAKLAEYGLQDRVHWKDLDASIFGAITLKEVSVDMRRQGEVQIESLKISDVIDNRDRQRVSLQLRGVKESASQAGGMLGRAVGLPTGRAELAPMDATLKLDARFDDDEGRLELSVRQKDAMDVDYRLEVTQIAGLRELARPGAGASPVEPPSMRGMGMSGRGMFGVMSAVTQVSLKSLEARVEDRGMVERGIALYKRHNIPLDVDGGSAKSQRDKAFEQSLQEWEASCRTQDMALATKEPEQTCRAVTRFLSGGKGTLRLSVKPKNPVSADAIINALMSRPSPSSVEMLNAEVKS